MKKFLVFGLFLTLSVIGWGQDRYWVFMNEPIVTQHPNSVSPNEESKRYYVLDSNKLALSDRAIERRRRQGIGIQPTDFNRPTGVGIPQYLRLAGYKIHGYSRWLNAYSVEPPVGVSDPNLHLEKSIAFQRGIQWPLRKVQSLEVQEAPVSFAVEARSAVAASPAPPDDHWYDYGEAWQQTYMVHGEVLHDQGFEGRGMLIAVLDGSFYEANVYGGLKRAFDEGRIVATYDFVNNDTNVFRATGTHGTRVFSIMGTELDGRLVGSAPKASYALLRSEDEGSETKVEEDNWIFAAEFADSLGADVINSSLGYTTFDSGNNYTPADMDGRTAIVTLGAVMAHRTGMVVVSSAGNTGTSNWRVVSAPADADSILAVGAVDSMELVGGFSGRGPSADGRVKPDVMAQGVLTAHLGQYGLVSRGNGTSFSSPVIAGFAACFWEANPGASNYEIMNWIRQSSDRYDRPNEDYGYGIPDFSMAMALSGAMELSEDIIYPNPTDGLLRLRIDAPEGAEFQVVDLMGRTVHSGTLTFPMNGSIELPATLSNGTYLLEIERNDEAFVTRFILYR